ncbi:MAG TPA: hypothetical protein PLE61_15665 [Vicinamibacterales bacterium]|nr:hypothetical protein [Vicinamibacterales bacterium]
MALADGERSPLPMRQYPFALVTGAVYPGREEYTMNREADVRWFADFVGNSRWRFAKTYVESYPHEYTLERWGDSDAFRTAIDCIERWGVVEPFWTSRRKYLYVDDRKYWHMGNVSSANAEDQPTLINRTWLEVGRYREQAKGLGYDGEVLDRLVARWNALLEKARRGA